MSQAFDDLVDQLNTLQDTSDSNQTTIDSLSNLLQPDGSIRSQLDFPLDPQSVQEITQLFPNGSVVLVAGAVTVSDARILASSVIVLSRAGAGGTLGHLSVASQSNGSFVINSSSTTDTSIINYVAFN